MRWIFAVTLSLAASIVPCSVLIAAEVGVFGSSKYGGSVWGSSNDSDGDGVPNSSDAFPGDPAASKDTDKDGKPDEWNAGKTQADSTSTTRLELDDDKDGDGVGIDAPGGRAGLRAQVLDRPQPGRAGRGDFQHSHPDGLIYFILSKRKRTQHV